MNKHISIIGCGWLGLPLASTLVKNGHTVKGSTTSVDKLDLLKHEGIHPFVVTISEEYIEGNISECLKGSEILIINIPPGLRKHPNADLVKKMQLLCTHIENSEIKNVLYVSSTSVYEETIEMPIITEDSPTNGQSSSSKQLIAAEQIFKINPNFKTTILRFGGLIGDDRYPAKFLSGKKDVKDPKGPVNLIHQNDCIGIIKAILENEQWQTDFNAAAPQHPTREHYYNAVCEAKNLPLPQFDHGTPSKGKIISSEKVEHLLNYEFLYKL
ncbi:nucleoside-diphosphate-sugar epimerase [Gelidibacter algens]|uniref:Nucleoside-diphosphate-sugar epimerase n=1 Tax=Gelidibacter algens TaxID=49280 RepID=A0A1A7R2R1_9FLAO|nr:NAD(P)-binding domain-containing protein [Gelidibacter algens]OBX26121.1 NAD(P)-dependent oxidoreductase [Gelidibacter algens]RAJ24519.1 nucleoside-diphosphate-sugar epimerase [Gelidibacter algens]